MPKGTITTDKVSISINKKIHKDLLNFCDDKLVNKSKLVNKLIKDFLDNNKEKDKEYE